MKTWANGKIIDGKAGIDSLNYSLHYAAPACWEGIRAYEQGDGSTKVYKLKEHIERLFDSAKILGVEIPFTKGQIEQACIDIVEANGNGDLYLRPIVYTSQDAESILKQEQSIAIDIYAFPISKLHKTKGKGIKVAISNLVRGYPQFNMQCKGPANYSMTELASQQTKALNVDDMLLVDNQGYITEATVANIWVFKGDVAMTPPNNGSILPGITRRTIAEILQSPKMFTKYKKVPLVAEKQITRADLYTADEILLCGTYAEIVSVIEVDARKVKDGEPGFYTKLLKDEYIRLARGIK